MARFQSLLVNLHAGTQIAGGILSAAKRLLESDAGLVPAGSLGALYPSAAAG